MKKLTFTITVLFLSLSSAFSQADVETARFMPVSTGTFYIDVYIPSASESNPKTLYIKWNDSQAKQPYTFTSPNSYLEYSGNAKVHEFIRVYSTEITHISIKSNFNFLIIMHNIRSVIGAKYNKMDRGTTDIFYQGLPNRNSKSYGEISIGSVLTSNEHFNGELKYTNMFEAYRKNWQIKDSHNDNDLNETWAKTNLIPAITYKTTATSGNYSLRLNTGYLTREFFPSGQNITIIDGNSITYHTVAVNEDYNSLANYQITKTASSNTIYIYGSLITHFYLDKLENLKVTGAKNLGNLRSVGSTSTNNLPVDLSSCDNLRVVNLSKNNNITGISAVSLNKLEILNLSNNPKLAIILIGDLNNLEHIYFSDTPKKPIPTSLDFPKLKSVWAENSGYTACQLNTIFERLPENHPAGSFISVNQQINPSNKNDYEGADKTIATGKSWLVRNSGINAATHIQLKGNGYECGHETPIAGSPVVTLTVSGANISMGVYGSLINADDSATPIWIENNSGQFIKKVVKKEEWEGFFTVPVLSSTMKIHGNLSGLDIRNQNISQIKISPNHPKINQFLMWGTKLSACALDEFYYDLPQRATSANARVEVKSGGSIIPGFLTSKSSIANSKKWKTIDSSGNTMSGNGVGCTTGIDDLHASETVKLYPNPASDRVVVQLPAESDVKQITILDLSGRELIRTAATDNKTTIDINELSSGIYLIKAGSIIRRLIVEQ